jgi:glycosidase
MMLETNIFRPVFLFFLLIFLHSAHVFAQVSCDPVFPTVQDNITITYDATKGNAALVGVSPVYAHMGVITNLSTSPTDWKYVPTTWGIADPVGAMQADGPNKWKKTININTFFNIAAGETVLKLSFVFRNTNGSTVGRAEDGSDIYYDVYPVNGPLQTKFITPINASFLTTVGSVIPVLGAASKTSAISLYDNGTLLNTNNGLQIQNSLNASAGYHQIQMVADANGEKDTSEFIYVVPASIVTAALPANTELGINYIDGQTVRLALYAPNKQIVYAIGDFSNWQIDPAFQMNRTPDGNTWWIELKNLPVNQPVRFQYLVNGNLRIADPLSTLVLDAGNDPFISANTFPNLTPYPVGKTSGAVSVLQTAQTPFNWSATNYARPKKTDLVVYELLARDFVANHDYQTILDSLDYFQRLGVTALELMPVNEFDGNISWGYNPAYHKATDKYYGSPEALKILIDECHKLNIAVIFDVVFNQASGSSPLAQLYWNATLNRPAADNPWLNPTATHDFNVFNDFNHESQATKAYVKNCLAHLIQEFKVDGFRFDLSKGFTQKVTLGNVSAWGQYDATRIATLKDYANFIWAKDPTNYVILEHFADNIEEKELAEYGMMLWGNMHGAYKDLGLGTAAGQNASVSGISYKNRSWTVPHLIGYMESHDEERIMVDLKNSGAVNGTYNVKNTATAVKRIAMLNNILYTIPGPKMLWQFGELGYDFSINLCENGSISTNCRTSPKPIRWDYYNDPARRFLYGRTAGLLQLRKNYDVFETTDFQLNVSTGKMRSVRLNSPTMNVVAVSNISTAQETVSIVFQHTGTWYDYYTGTPFEVSGANANLTLEPGDYRLFIDQLIPFPGDIVFLDSKEAAGKVQNMLVYPNPATDYASVDFSLNDQASVQLEVVDLAGKRIFNVTTDTLPAGDYHYELRTENWAAGVYFVTLRDPAGARITKKLIK